MATADPTHFHRLYAPKRQRIAYHRSDFADYALMTLATAVVVWLAYGAGQVLSLVGVALCAFMLVSFPLRHGVELRVPTLLKRPHEVLYSLAYKLQNVKPMYLVALAVLLVDQLAIRLTPGLPHHVETMRSVAVGLFFTHLIAVSLYRTVILVAHLRSRDTVRAVLEETSWKVALERQPNVTIHILHAYFTGLLTHIVLLAPWYIVLTHVSYSIVTLPVVCAINVVVHLRYMRSYSDWFYRDHWVSHNSELDFVYLHGPHHDAIPSGLIGVSGNGYLEGFLRHSVGNPAPFYSPVVSFLWYTLEVTQDIKNHQYIPGVYPKLPRGFHEVSQHSTHHFGRLEPYGIALRMGRGGRPGPSGKSSFPPEELLNSIALDEQLTGFQWDNPRYRRYLELFDKYQK